MGRRPESPKRRRRSATTRARTTSVAERTRARRRVYRRLEAFDRRLLEEGAARLAGIDEAGRGALAGPVAAAAVVLPRNSRLIGVDDSKKLAEAEREALFVEITRKALAVGLAFAQPGLIDRRNVLNATLQAMARALESLRLEPELVVVDGRDRIDVPCRVISIEGGDGKSLSVAAASIVAKVARDRLMRKLHRAYPAYNFLSNKGYGTKEHLEAIQRNGMSAAHRRSYRVNAVADTPSLF